MTQEVIESAKLEESQGYHDPVRHNGFGNLSSRVTWVSEYPNSFNSFNLVLMLNGSESLLSQVTQIPRPITMTHLTQLIMWSILNWVNLPPKMAPCTPYAKDQIVAESGYDLSLSLSLSSSGLHGLILIFGYNLQDY